MSITLNGKPHELAGTTTVASLVISLGLDTRRIAIERNLEIVPKSEYATTTLMTGDAVEIVEFIGGG